ncbi:MAG: N-acetylmuramoyl-L-alanine amidase [Phycisphaeraceae bacterium]|nr:N-acetylmuramoyl-L-alanine amidase [Phycisphaeraceae bacterium]MCW5753806.1 N-acetylmuramoyl-L-alanine amidase [Phycisphaeraceae bacterium]
MTRSSPKAARRKPSSRRRTARQKGVSARTKVVWGSLLAAMTGGAGMLFMLEGAGMPRLDGMALPALAATSGPASVEGIFRTRTDLDRARWKAIVIHHTGAPFGTPESIDAAHRELGLRGLGHHFVIGNGSGLGDGEIHAGYRWLDQLPGAHALGEQAEWFDRHSLSICLVGDGDRRQFTRAQILRTSQLVMTLARELDIPPDRIYLQKELAPVTDPGFHFPEGVFREMLAGLR